MKTPRTAIRQQSEYVVYLTYCDEKNSAHNGENGSLKAAGEGHPGMAGFQKEDLRNIRHWFISNMPGQPEHTARITIELPISRQRGCSQN